MKAQYVYENIEFERGLEPKKSMNIGREYLLKKSFKSEREAGLWVMNNIGIVTNFEYTKDTPIKIEGDFYTYTVLSNNLPKKLVKYFNEWADSVRINGHISYDRHLLFQNFKAGLNIPGYNIIPAYKNESLDFERGQEPKDAMGIGRKAQRKFNSIPEAAKWFYTWMEYILDGKYKPEDLYLIQDEFWNPPFLPTKIKMPIIKWFRHNIILSGSKPSIGESIEFIRHIEKYVETTKYVNLRGKARLEG